MTRFRCAFLTILLAAMTVNVLASTGPQAELDPWRNVVRVGQNFTLPAGDTANEVVVIFGDATIDGRVHNNVVVIFGRARLAATADVDSLVVVGGTAAIAANAIVHQNLVVVGGSVDAPASFTPGDQYVVIGPTLLGGQFDALTPWFTRGLLWGRLIVPDLRWNWVVVGMFFFVYLALAVLFDSPVRASATTLAEKPLTSFAAGVLVLLLFGPVCVLLAVSVVGLAVIPFVSCALFLAAVFGRIGVARWIGERVVGGDANGSRAKATAAFTIGFAVLCIAYMVPVLAFIVWTLVGVLGLGAASLAFATAYRRERPAPVNAPPPGVPPMVPIADDSAPSSPVAAPPVPPPPAAAAEPASFVAPGPPPAAPMMMTDVSTFPRAPFRDRLAAFAIDVVLVLIAKEILAEHREGDFFFLLLLVYHIGFWAWKGTTVGGIICQLRVVRADGAPLTFGDALVRGLAGILSLGALGIGGLWILKDPERQAWHDRIAGTYVVKVPRNWPV